MRFARAVVLVLVAACGGSQDSNKQTLDQEQVRTDTEMEREPEEKKKAPPPPPPKPMTIEERVAFHDGCFADFLAEAPDFFERCYTESSSDEMVDSGAPPAVGVEAIKASVQPFWTGFKLEGEGVLNVANGDNVVSIGVVRATHDGDFNGMPASGKVSGLLVAEVQNLDDKGRHGNVRTYLDFGAFMGHLGLAPKGAKFRKPVELTGNPVTTVIATGDEAETANVAVIEGAFAMFNKKDWKGLTALYAADAVISHQAAPDDNKGTKAIGKMLKELSKGFPDAQEEVATVWGAGDYVVAETTFSGTNKAAMPGMGIKKATKKKATLRTAHVFKMEGGKIKEHWIFGNGLALAMQLGLVKPPPAPAPAE